MNLLILSALVIITLATQASALRCYSCQYENDRKCKGEGAELGDIAYTVDPDEDEFKYCFKISYDGDKKGERGVLDKVGLDGFESDYDAKNGKCSKDQEFDTETDAVVCVCDSDNCNGSGALAASILTIAILAIVKIFQ